MKKFPFVILITALFGAFIGFGTGYLLGTVEQVLNIYIPVAVTVIITVATVLILFFILGNKYLKYKEA